LQLTHPCPSLLRKEGSYKNILKTKNPLYAQRREGGRAKRWPGESTLGHSIHDMKVNSKFIIIAGLCGLVVVMTAATNTNKPKPADDHYKNLQVLPKNTTGAMMNKIMVGEFEDALGVSCGFCHAANKEGDGLDYASDTKPEKQIARQMLRMTLNLNRDYFKIDTPMVGTDNIVVTCNTCHKGDTFPDGEPAKN